jgi:hypothetical protein
VRLSLYISETTLWNSHLNAKENDLKPRGFDNVCVGLLQGDSAHPQQEHRPPGHQAIQHFLFQEGEIEKYYTRTWTTVYFKNSLHSTLVSSILFSV